MENSEISMHIVNPSAAGIDVGSRSHFVAIGQEAHQYDIASYLNVCPETVSRIRKNLSIRS